MELDVKTLAQIREIGGDELLGRLARLFLEHTPLRLEEIRRGLASDDWSRTARAVHSLRSSSVTLGAIELAETAARLESLAGEQKREDFESGLPELEEETRTALLALKKLAEVPTA